MKEQARRSFIRTGLYAAVSGLGLSVFYPFTGFGKTRSPGSRNMPLLDSPEPSYLELHRSGELKKRGEELWQIMQTVLACYVPDSGHDTDQGGEPMTAKALV